MTFSLSVNYGVPEKHIAGKIEGISRTLDIFDMMVGKIPVDTEKEFIYSFRDSKEALLKYDVITNHSPLLMLSPRAVDFFNDSRTAEYKWLSTKLITLDKEEVTDYKLLFIMNNVIQSYKNLEGYDIGKVNSRIYLSDEFSERLLEKNFIGLNLRKISIE